MLPARGPRPMLKGESQLTLRLMDDVQIPQVQATIGPDWRFFGRPQPQNESYRGSLNGSLNNGSLNNGSLSNASLNYDNSGTPRLARRDVMPASSEPMVEEVPQVTYASYTPTSASANVTGSAPRIAATAPGVPVFVLKTGMVLAVGNYTYQDGRIAYELAGGGNGVISSDEVDWTTTTQVNQQRGVRVTLRAGHSSTGAAGF